MHRTRCVTDGRLAELFGEEALKLDVFARTLGYRRLAEQNWEALSAKNKEILQAYADGVNDFID